MTFQFLCPQGHLLQGEEAHMGLQCQCPQCGVAFIIPTVTPQAASPQPPAPKPSPPQQSSPSSSPFDLAPLEEEQPAPPSTKRKKPSVPKPPAPSGDFDELDLSSVTVPDDEAAAEEVIDEVLETLLHIPCPNGHVLDVPLDMIGAKAMCPHCRAPFRLRREKSLEFLREQELIDAKRARFWFKLAVIAAGVVVVVLIVMILAIALT
jgi:hypothetical protein